MGWFEYGRDSSKAEAQPTKGPKVQSTVSATSKDDSSKTASSKGKEKGITIKELAPQPYIHVQSDKSKDTSRSKHDGKNKVGESKKALMSTRLCTESVVKTHTLLVSTTPASNL